MSILNVRQLKNNNINYKSMVVGKYNIVRVILENLKR